MMSPRGRKESDTMEQLLLSLSRLVTTFLPRSKRLLISWLQSPSAVTLEPKNGIRCHDLSFLDVEF